MNDKIRPVHERLSQIEGGTTFRDLREGVGGFANITQHDLMAGLAIVKRIATKDLVPEMLETYFASTQSYRRKIVDGYLAHHRVEAQHIPALRMGATLGAQMMAGVTFSTKQDDEFAFICNVRQSTLRDLRKTALGWYQELLDSGIPLFADVLRQIIERRQYKRAADFLEGSLKHDCAVEKRKATATA